MLKIRTKTWLQNVQTAQGMVEFALVLPVLLLLILGIFAFGHLFFVYSSVVSASREAARWGAAVGESPTSFPRYQDCGAIRAQAVRVGAFAGVNASAIDPSNPEDAGVDIAYDHGPDPVDGHSAPYATCPEVGDGPTDVVMGDRIIVRVKVYYTPIVPVVNLPSFPLEATTFRTILKSVPVGEAPTAVDPCTTSTTIHLAANPEPSRVGEPVVYTIQVTEDDPTTDDITEVTGDVTLTDVTDDPSHPISCSGTLVDSSFTCPAATYWKPGIKNIHVTYHSDNTCQLDSRTDDPGTDPTHEVVKADTQIVLSASPDFKQVNQAMTITARVLVVPPGAGLPGTVVPTGKVRLTFPGQPDQYIDLPADGTVNWTFAPSSPGDFVITAEYPGDANFEVPDINPVTLTIHINSATPTPGVTPMMTPTIGPSPTVPPPYCPIAPGGLAFSNANSTITVNLSNTQSAAQPVQLSVVDLTWSRIPNSPITQILFGGSALWPDPNYKKTLPVLAPMHQIVSGSTGGWNGPGATLSNGGNTNLVITLGGAMPSGSTNKYTLGLTFRSTVNGNKRNPDCVLTIVGYNY